MERSKTIKIFVKIFSHLHFKIKKRNFKVDSRRLISGDEFKKALRKREKEMKSVQQKGKK